MWWQPGHFLMTALTAGAASLAVPSGMGEPCRLAKARKRSRNSAWWRRSPGPRWPRPVRSRSSSDGAKRTTGIVELVGLADPAAVSPDLQVFIDKQATDRAVRRELAVVFATDPAYADLVVSTTHLKTVLVTVHGSVSSRPDWVRLRARLAAECPAVQQCGLHWDVRVRDTGDRLHGYDPELPR